jgi:hypothetical protein
MNAFPRAPLIPVGSLALGLCAWAACGVKAPPTPMMEGFSPRHQPEVDARKEAIRGPLGSSAGPSQQSEAAPTPTPVTGVLGGWPKPATGSPTSGETFSQEGVNAPQNPKNTPLLPGVGGRGGSAPKPARNPEPGAIGPVVGATPPPESDVPREFVRTPPAGPGRPQPSRPLPKPGPQGGVAPTRPSAPATP